MPVEESISRGANQVLFTFLPGQLVEYPKANAVVLVKSWGSMHSGIPSKKRVLDKVYSAIFGRGSKYGDIDRLFPRKADIDKFYFGEPFQVNCQLYPLVFTEEGNNKVHIFREVKHLNLFLNRWKGPRLMQRDIIFINTDGEMDQLQPIVDLRRRPLKLEKLGESQAAYRWVDAETGQMLGRVFGILGGKRINVGTPVRARRTFLPQIISLVNIRDYIDVETDSDKELLGSLVLAKYVYGCVDEMTVSDAFEKLRKTKALSSEEIVRKILGSAGVNFDSLPDDKKKDMLVSASPTDMGPAKIDISKIRSSFPRSKILSTLDEIYEYIETINSEGKVTLQEMHDNAESGAKKEMYKQFIEKLNKINISTATYLEDVPLINLAYGYVRGEFDIRETTLRPFHPDDFDRTKSKIPIYLTEMKTEGILLELDREKIIEFLLQKGIISKAPKVGEEKEWFIKNVDPTEITRFSGVMNKGVTKEVFKIVHAISHALIKQIPEQCGIGVNQIGEIIFPSIPAILIFSKEIGDFRLGALKDLFENKIYPWVDISFKKSKLCFYDPVCFHGDGACHSCMFINEISCGYFNQDLTRHVLFGSVRRKTKGFWDSSLKKF